MAQKSILAGIWLAAFLAIALVQTLGAPASQPPAAASATGVPATTQGVPATAPDLVAMGKTLFVAKGCVNCHAHRDFTSATESFGPVLSDYQPNAEYVRRWLHDPAAIKPATQMPNLRLSEAEIDALIAYLAE
jgi:mono/diheme cytochrome c family protein